jgi:two-component sensor histidine kinase
MGMLQLILSGIVTVFSVLEVAAQFPKELLLRIQASKPDTNRISLQLQLGTYYLFKPGDYKDDLDSTYHWLNQAAKLSDSLHEVDWQYRTLALLGYYYGNAGDLSRCKQCLDRVITYYHQVAKTDKEAAAWDWLGDLYKNNDKNDHRNEAISCYQQARALYLKNHDQVKAADELISIAEIQFADKRFGDRAETNLLQALAELKAAGYKGQLVLIAYDWLHLLEYQKGNYYRAMAYSSAGIDIMKAGGDSTFAGRFYFRMARGNNAVKKYKEALEWARKATTADKDVPPYRHLLIEILLALNQPKQAWEEINNLTAIKNRLNFLDTVSQYRILAVYYDTIKKSDLALQYYKKILKLDLKGRLSEEIYKTWFVTCTNAIAGIYLKTKQPEKAKAYLDSTLLAIKKTKVFLKPGDLVPFYHHLYQYDLATGNYQAAVKDLEEHDRIKDSIFTADKDKQIAELDIQYRSAEKEQAIKYLHSQSIVQQTQLEKANMQRNITIGGIVLVSLFAGLFYRQFRQKQHANLVITQKSKVIGQKNAMLEELLGEKEWLIKEVHHRVKNNLHTVICLLESQSRYLENDALDAIHNSQHRIYAMSLIHQKLYQSEDVKTIDMKTYLHEFVQYLADSFGSTDLIHFQLDIAPLTLGVSHAIPLGLIINEAVTNSIKYAFPENQMGVISIQLSKNKEMIELVVADNGIGIPAGIAENEINSLGIDLMKGLSKDIKGKIHFETRKGTKITVTFKVDPFDSEEHSIVLQERTQYA